MTDIRKLRIFHIADIHFRVARFDEYAKVIDLTLREIEIQNPDIVAIVGDIFHDKDKVHSDEENLFNRLIKGILKFEKIHIVMIPGNHDVNLANSRASDLISPLFVWMPDRVHYFPKSGTYEIKEFRGYTWNVYSPIDKYEFTQPPPSETCNIALVHETIKGAIMPGSGIEIKNARLDYKMLDAWYDLTLLGDVHKVNFMTPKVAYCGSLLQQSYGEDPVEHGYIMWTLNGKKANGKHHIILNPEGSEVKVILENDKNITKPSLDQIPKIKGYRLYYKSCSADYITKVKEEIFAKHGVKPESEKCKDQFKAITGVSKLERKEVGLTNVDILRGWLEENKCAEQEAILAYHQKLESDIEQKFPYHGKWWPLYMEWKNMFGYGNDIIYHIKFDEYIKWNESLGRYNFIGISGPNKAGKSSIFDIMTYLLWNKCTRGTLDEAVLNRKSSKFECRIVIQSSDGNIYTMKKRGLSKNQRVTMLWVNEKSENKSTPQETHKYLETVIGTYDDFVRVTYQAQDAFLFASLGSAEQKKYLSSVIGFDKRELYEQKVKADMAKLKEQVDALDVQGYTEDEINRAIANNRTARDKDNATIELLNREIADLTNKCKEISRITGACDGIKQTKLPTESLDDLLKMSKYPTTIEQSSLSLEAIESKLSQLSDIESIDPLMAIGIEKDIESQLTKMLRPSVSRTELSEKLRMFNDVNVTKRDFMKSELQKLEFKRSHLNLVVKTSGKTKTSDYDRDRHLELKHLVKRLFDQCERHKQKIAKLSKLSATIEPSMPRVTSDEVNALIAQESELKGELKGREPLRSLDEINEQLKQLEINMLRIDEIRQWIVETESELDDLLGLKETEIVPSIEYDAVKHEQLLGLAILDVKARKPESKKPDREPPTVREIEKMEAINAKYHNMKWKSECECCQHNKQSLMVEDAETVFQMERDRMLWNAWNIWDLAHMNAAGIKLRNELEADRANAQRQMDDFKLKETLEKEKKYYTKKQKLHELTEKRIRAVDTKSKWDNYDQQSQSMKEYLDLAAQNPQDQWRTACAELDDMNACGYQKIIEIDAMIELCKCNYDQIEHKIAYLKQKEYYDLQDRLIVCKKAKLIDHKNWHLNKIRNDKILYYGAHQIYEIEILKERKVRECDLKKRDMIKHEGWLKDWEEIKRKREIERPLVDEWKWLDTYKESLHPVEGFFSAFQRVTEKKLASIANEIIMKFKTKDVLDVQDLTFTLNGDSLTMGSGFQKCITTIAIKLALAQFPIPCWNVLIIDEGLSSSLDEANMFTLQNDVIPFLPCPLFLISHHDTLLHSSTHRLLIPHSLPTGVHPSNPHYLKPEILRQNIFTQPKTKGGQGRCNVCDIETRNLDKHWATEEHTLQLLNWLIV